MPPGRFAKLPRRCEAGLDGVRGFGAERGEFMVAVSGQGPRAARPPWASVGLALVMVGLAAIVLHLSYLVLAVVGLPAGGASAGAGWMLVGAVVPTVMAVVIVVLVWKRRR
jgi:hypothetical protein